MQNKVRKQARQKINHGQKFLLSDLTKNSTQV